MIKIATPISTLFREAEFIERIVSLSDCLEVREHSMLLPQFNLPRIYHCDLGLEKIWSDRDLAITASTFRDHQVSGLVSLHLKSCYARPTLINGAFYPGFKRLTEKEIYSQATSNLAGLREALDSDLNILVENNNYYPTGAYDIVTDPEFITRLVQSLGIGLLLDLPHAMVTAWNHDASLDWYLNRLDLTLVRQLALSGDPVWKNSFYYDSHAEISETTWECLPGIIARCPNLQFMSIEYYQDEEKLLAMTKRLRKILGKKEK